MAETFKGEQRTNAHLKYPYTAEHEDDTFLDWEFTPAGGEGAVHKAFVDNPEGPWAHDVDGTINDHYPYRGEVTPTPDPIYIETASDWNFSKRYITWESVLGTDGNIYTAKRNLPPLIEWPGYPSNPENTKYRPITGNVSEGWDHWWEPIYEYEHGSGEKEDPYQVWTLDDLFGVNYRLHAWYIQMANIDASPAACVGYYDPDDQYNRFSSNAGSFVSIGWSNRWNGEASETWQGADFSGVYDGNGYIISNIRISKWVEGSGVFRAVGQGAIVKRVSVTNMIGDVAYTDEAPDNFYRGSKGGIAGRNGGLIKDCLVSVTLSSGGTSGTNNYFGGRVDLNNISLDDFGGIVGLVYRGGAVARCHTIVNVNQPPEEPSDPPVALRISICGGIAGKNGGTIAHCSSTGAINGTTYVGGVTGLHGYLVWHGSLYENLVVGGTMYNCMAHVAVSSGSPAGGLIGLTNHNADAGGVGEYAGCVVNCYSVGAVTVGSGRGGLIGVTQGIKPEIINCYYDSQTSGQSDTGKGEPRTTAQMVGPLDQTVPPYGEETYLGWHEFAWIAGGHIDGYPSLNEEIISVANSSDFADINENRWGEYRQAIDIDLGGTNRVGCCHIIDYETKYPSTNVEGGEYGRRWWGFSGTYDGEDRKITNLRITRGDDEEIQFRGLPEAFQSGIPDYFALSKRGYHTNQGLFSEVTYASEGLYNINLEGVEIEITVEPEDWGSWQPSRSPLHALGWGIGGLVGGLSADVYNCHVKNVEISGCASSAGGLIGRQHNSGTRPTGGGFPIIVGCTATNVSMQGSADVGGFIGMSEGYVFINDCTVTGVSVGGTFNLGGFSGIIYSSRVDYPWDMPVEQRAPHLSDCEATDVFVTQRPEIAGHYKWMDNVGGFVGKLGTNMGVVKNCILNNAVVEVPDSYRNAWAIGGFAGEAFAIVLECHTGIDVTVDTPASTEYLLLGGFVGYNRGILQNCYSRTTMNTDPAIFDEGSYTEVGGLVGENIGWITYCYARTSVDDNEGGDHPRGGLVGYGSQLRVTNSYYHELGPADPTLIKIADCYNPTTPVFSVSLDYGAFNNMVIERQDPMIAQYRFTNPPTGLTLKTKWRYLTPKLEHNVVCGFECRGILIRYKLKGKKPKLIPEFD